MSFIREVRSDIEREAVRLLREYRSSLFREAVRLCGDVHTAEDLVMRTIETFFAKREDELPPDDKTYSWLRTTLQNLYWNMVRTKAYARTVYVNTSDAAKLDEIAPVDNSTDEAIVAHDEAELVHRAIASLPKDTRNVIMLRYFESLSIGEIAKLTCRSIDSIKCNLYYARKVLAKRLAKALGRTSAVAIGLVLTGLSLLYAAAIATGFAPSPFAAAEPAAEEAEVVFNAKNTKNTEGSLEVFEGLSEECLSSGFAPMNHEFESTNITTNNEDNTMNTQVVKSAAVKALAAGAMLAATAPLDAIADEGKSASDYVLDGLVAQWDGVENAGVGLHEDSPSAWVDIVGGLEITIPEWVTVETNAFYSESSTATRTYPSISSIPGLGNDVTIEVVAERVMWRDKTNYGNLQRIISSPYAKFGYRQDSTAGVFYQMPIGTNNKLWLYTSTSGSFNVSECHTYTARVTMPRDESNTLLVDAATVPGWAKEGSDGMPTDPPTNWTFFDAQRADIRIYAIRVYNRKLTDAEVTANAAVDNVRFVEGKISGGRLKSALENVSTNSAGLVWSYVPVGESVPLATVRFVSGFEPDLSDGVARSLGAIPANTVVTSAVSFVRTTATYWRLEAEDTNGKSYVTATKTVPAFSLDSTSYVSSGLVAQWDGVENAGRGVHSDSPTVWKDLVGSNDITLPAWVSATAKGMDSVGSSESRTYPELASITGLDGDDVTIEVAARRVRWTQTDDYGNLQPFFTSPWGHFGYRFNQNDAFYAYLPPNGNNAGQAKLYNINTGTGGAKVTECQTIAGRITRNSSSAQNGLFINAAAQTLVYANYSANLGSSWKFFNNPRTEIEFYAIRVYNRRLTSSELAGNAWADRLRVTGEMTDNAAAPLQIAYDGAGASVRKGYYCWPVPGEAFSHRVAYSVPDGDYQSLCVGWTRYVETSTDVWEEEAHGATCEASYLPDSRRHRLVFHTAKWRDFPAGYARLDGLVANGNQIIDTGYYPNYHTYCVIDLKFTGNTYNYQGSVSPFGAPAAAGGLQFSANFGGNANQGTTLFFWTRYNYATGGDSEIRQMTTTANTVKNRSSLIIHMTDGGAQYGDTLIGIKQRTEDQTQSTTFRLFGLTAPFNGYDSMTIYGTKLGERVGTDTTYQRDLVPARSTETGIRGLYDYVTGGFFTNIVENAAEDFAGDATGLHVDGEPARIGEPTIPYGHCQLESGAVFELSETNTVKTTGHRMHVKSIARYTYNDTTGAWTLAERTKGGKVTATYSGAPTRYVLEWAENTGFFFIVH